LEGNARVDWTRQKFILRKRVTHTPPVHPFLHRILVHSPPLTNMTLKEQEEEEQTPRTNRVYRLVSMEWLEYIRRGGRKGRRRRQVHRDVGSLVRSSVVVVVNVVAWCARSCGFSFITFSFIFFACCMNLVEVCRGSWGDGGRKRLWGAAGPARQSSSTKDKWFRALGRLTWNALRNLMMTDRTAGPIHLAHSIWPIPCRFGAVWKRSEGVGRAEPRHK
jgi:hypothetical protein